MKGKIGIVLCCIFIVIGESSAQKKRKYTDKKEIQHPAFDSILKHSFKNKILIASHCDTSLLIAEMSAFKKAIEEQSKDPMQLISNLGNFYHAWMMLTLCRNPSLIRAGNDSQFFLRDTILLDQVPYTMQSLRESILRLGMRSKLPLAFILWNGMKSGASPPKKAWIKQSLQALIRSAGKSYFKNADDEFTADLSVNTLNISETLLDELNIDISSKEISIASFLHIISPFLPDHISAYCALNKSTITVRSVQVSDILARSP